MSNTNSGESIGVAGLLGVAFVVLKLCHVIDWSWWWVTAPFWLGAALLVSILLGITVVAGITSIFVAIFAGRRERKRAILRAKVDRELRDSQRRKRNVR